MRTTPLFSCAVLAGWALAGADSRGDQGGRGTADRTAEAELTKWAGNWKGPGGATLTIDGNRFTSAAPGDGSFRGTARIVEVGRDAVRADLRIEEDGEEVMVVPAIFRLEGDTLHYCGNDPGKPHRPNLRAMGRSTTSNGSGQRSNAPNRRLHRNGPAESN